MNRFGTRFRIALVGRIARPADRRRARRRACRHRPYGRRFRGRPRPTPLRPDSTTPRHEPDVPQIVSGIYRGYTTGAPLTIEFTNTDTRPQDYDATAGHDRPSHADRTAYEKFSGWNDPRGGGHFSGRLTLTLTAAGVVAKKMLPANVAFSTDIVEIGGCTEPERFDTLLHETAEAKDSVGGMVECRVQGVPAGLGDPYFDSAESVIAQLLLPFRASRE